MNIASETLRAGASAAVVRIAFVSIVVVALGQGCACGQVPLEIPSDTTVMVPGRGINIGRPLDPTEVFPVDVIGPLLSEQISQSLDTSGYKKQAVTSMKLTLMKLTVKDPEDNGRAIRGLAFLSSLIMFVGEDDTKTKAAFSDDGVFDGNPGPATYTMQLTDAELNPALQAKDTLAVNADVTPGTQPNFDTEVKFDFVMSLTIDPTKAL